MVASYFTYKALVAIWRQEMVGALVGDVYSQHKDELTIAFASPQKEWMLRILTKSQQSGIFRVSGYNRAKRNVVTLFPEALDKVVTEIRVAEKDRYIFIELSNGWQFQLQLFGRGANVFLLDEKQQIHTAFQDQKKWQGHAMPKPRPASMPETFEAFRDVWNPQSNTLEQALARAMPLLNSLLISEIISTVALSDKTPQHVSESELGKVYQVANQIQHQVEHPTPVLYWENQFVKHFSLCRLTHLSPLKEESFDSLDDAVRIYLRTKIAQHRFKGLYDPLWQNLQKAYHYHQHQTERILEELNKRSRADTYETWGHLLMSAITHIPKGVKETILPNTFTDGALTEIPLDPRLSTVENAQRYYEKARKTRLARTHAEARWEDMTSEVALLETLLHTLESCTTYAQVEKFIQKNASELSKYVGYQKMGQEAKPFRRFEIDGYEVWVGRNAKENEELTFKFAQKHDLWFHARDVAGSHVVLRRTNKQAQPPAQVLEKVAATAAFYSQARTTGLAPVQYTERKYVRKIKNAPPGLVRIEKETVLLVEPQKPK